MRKYAFRLILAFVLLAGWPAARLQARQTVARQPEERSAVVNRAVDELGGYYSGSAQDQADAALKRIGYTPPVPAAEWAAYPAERKIYMAYLGAVAADPVEGGEKYLALMSHNLARLWDSARHSIDLAPYLAKPKPSAVHFTSPAATPVQLPRQVDAAITVLADYYSGPAGSARQVLVHHFRLTDDAANALLRQSPSNVDAFRRAAHAADAATREAAVRSWAAEARTHYDAVSYEPALRPFLSEPTIGPPTPNPPVHAPVPPRPAGGSTSVSRFGSIMSELPTLSFSTVSRVEIGPGGVVFGNKVSALLASKPVSIRFVPGTTTGVFEIVLDDGTRLVHGDVPAELAFVAYQIVAGSGTAPASGDVIGLVGITDNIGNVSCAASTRSVSYRSQLFHTAINPTLADREIGWAALMVDSLPVRQKQLVALVGNEAGVGAGVTMRELLDSDPPSGFIYQSTWKVVDVPIELAAEDGMLVAQRVGGGPAVSTGVRRSAFLEMRRILLPDRRGADHIKDSTYDKPFAAKFYRMLPVLTRVSPDYSYLNQFARVLAVARWAVQNGARFQPPAATTPVPTPDALLLSDTAIQPVASYDPKDALKANIERLDACRAAAENEPAVHTFATSLEKADEAAIGELLENGARRADAIGYWCKIALELVQNSLQYEVLATQERGPRR